MFEKCVWYPDYYRTTNDTEFVLLHFLKDLVFQHRLRFVIALRYAKTSKTKIARIFFDFVLYRMSRKYGLEIKSCTNIGKGFCITHPYNITVHQKAVIGENVSMLKGSTVGISMSGAPVIGNNVYIGLNSTVIGGITVGDNVLIAPNTMVNVNVPSNSVVIGCPCRIIPKDNPTKNYIWKVYTEE